MRQSYQRVGLNVLNYLNYIIISFLSIKVSEQLLTSLIKCIIYHVLVFFMVSEIKAILDMGSLTGGWWI